jgi:glycosyltransferase involved in cell wall biosynthesis
MKICMFLASPFSRDGRVKKEVAALVADGHEVFVITYPEPDMPVRETFRGAHVYRLTYPGRGFRRQLYHLAKTIRGSKNSATDSTRSDTKSPSGGSADISTVDQRRRKIIDKLMPRRFGYYLQMLSWISLGLYLRADAYQAHDLDALEHAYICAKLTGKKLVYDSHELFLDWQQARGVPRDLIRIFRRVETSGIQRADLVITVSDGIADELKTLYHIRSPLVVRNCAEAKPPKRFHKIREHIGGDAKRLIALYQGNMEPNRGLMEMVFAADFVPEVDFVFIGLERPYKEKLKEAAAQSKHKNVFILPQIPHEDLWQYTHSADFGFIQTQPFCLSFACAEANKIFEYMAAEIPVIASAIRGHKRLAKETDAILLTDPYNPQSIADAVKILLENPERRKQMGKNGRQAVETTYNNTREMKKLTDAYRKL